MRKNPGPLVRSVDRGAPTVIEGVAHAVDAVFAGQEGDDADYPLEVRS